MVASIGLVIISLAWFVQLFFAFKGKKDIRSEFIVLYIVGVVLLLISYIQSNSYPVTFYFEAATLVSALLVLMKKLKK